MKSTKPVIINREKTIIIEASEKHSYKNGNASYETVLNTPVEINNGDTVTLSKAFVDTSKIDPSKIYLADPVDITWNNGLYLINQQLRSVIPSSARSPGEIITDNKPIIFCQNHVEADSKLVLWTQVTTHRVSTWVPQLKWGGVKLSFQIKDANGNLQTVTRDVPAFGPDPFIDDNVEHEWDLNIVGQLSYPPKTWDEQKEEWISAGTEFQDLLDVSQGGINIPITDVGTQYVDVDSGFLTPVINTGKFTIPSGSYEPAHIAKLITDKFSTMNSTRLTIDPVAKQNLYPYDLGVGNFTQSLFTLPSIAFQQLPFSWSLSCLEGWSVSITYITANAPLVYTNFVSTVMNSEPADAVNTFRIFPALDLLEATTPAYPTGGGPRVVLTPPDGYYDGGSSFLQYTHNYNIKGVDGKPMFVFADCSPDHTNVFTYPLDDNFSWFGSNNIELVWDDDQKRFRFNYLHFPLTDATSAPAIINQVTFNNSGSGDYQRNYAAPIKSTNITSTSFGGIFFTSLEPQRSFWQKILGFSSDMIVTISQDITKKTFTGGFDTAAGAHTGFTNITLPLINLEYGKHITEQLVVMGDITGQPPDYTGFGQTIFSSSATPDDGGAGGTGRVAIAVDNVRGITADNSTTIGLQTSGFYIVDIDIGTTYNKNIGSDRNQQGYSRNIRGVIDRYYSANSYTSTQGGDIQYIHYGNSISISKIKVRFKNSDGSEIVNIGGDNTIFLKVSKNNEINITPDPLPPKTQ